MWSVLNFSGADIEDHVFPNDEIEDCCEDKPHFYKAEITPPLSPIQRPSSVTRSPHAKRSRTTSTSLSSTKKTSKESVICSQFRTIYTAGRPPWYNCLGQHVEPFVIGICGGSASGKTTVAAKIIESLDVPWVTLLSMDSFYKASLIWILFLKVLISRCFNLLAFRYWIKSNTNKQLATNTILTIQMHLILIFYRKHCRDWKRGKKWKFLFTTLSLILENTGPKPCTGLMWSFLKESWHFMTNLF